MSQPKLDFGQYYHMYHCGNKDPIFREEENFYLFLSLFKKYLKPIVDLYAYCLLPTHFHLLIRIKDFDEIGEIYFEEKMLSCQYKFFLGAYTKEINQIYNRSGYLIGEKSSREIVKGELYFYKLIVYIHQNPQIHGIVSDFRYWPFSSYSAYDRKDRRSIISKDLFFDDVGYNNLIEMQAHLKMGNELRIRD
ncbi:MAG: transposase [Chloroflexi bacterium]|nr:transposase [Chloroflexota bacterium]